MRSYVVLSEKSRYVCIPHRPKEKIEPITLYTSRSNDPTLADVNPVCTPRRMSSAKEDAKARMVKSESNTRKE